MSGIWVGKDGGEWGLFWEKWLRFLIFYKLFCILASDAFNN